MQEQEFIDSKTNDRFVIIGVDYQPGGQGAYGSSNSQDPLSNGTTCLRDAALMQNLGVNTIRSYNVDPTLNHDECMSIFNSVGIYVILDVNSPLAGQSIDRSNPSGTYTIGYLQHIFSVVEAFKSFDNVLGFFAGNEVINDVPTAKDNPAYIRAVQRDLKNYISNHASRQIPVGYSAADVRQVLEDTWAYLQCNNSDGSGPDSSRSDFFGLNSYSWCGSQSSFQTSGYDVLVQMFSNTTIPVFFSEYGCNDPSPRVFDEVPSLYGPQMTVLSGGLVYEWTQDTNNYGLVWAYENGTAQLRSDYDSLQGQFSKINITLLESNNGTATSLQPPKCSSGLISEDGFETSFDIPSPPDGADALISSGVSNAPTGSFVPVTSTSVEDAVYATNGAPISGLAITTVQGANTPGAASGLSTGAAPSSTGGSNGGGSASATSTGSSGSSGSGGSGGSSATATGSAGAASSSAAAVRSVFANGAAVGGAVAMAVFAL